MLPNLLSILRIPLALSLFWLPPPWHRFVFVAALGTDMFDGFLARLWKQTSYIGTLLDPLCDKIFVLVALSYFYSQHALSPIDLFAFLARDVGLCMFSLMLLSKGEWKTYRIRPFWAGKMATSMQYVGFISLTLFQTLPPYFFSAMLLLGLGGLTELIVRETKTIS